MRGAVLAACFAVASCVAQADNSRYYYQGVYVAGATSINDDGGFVSRASVWTAEDLVIAKQAAIFRLQKAAETRGYAYALLASAGTSKSFGNQFRMEGVLYPEGSLPDGAVPLAALDSSLLAGPTDEIQTMTVSGRTNLENRRKNEPKGREVHLAAVPCDCQITNCTQTVIRENSKLNCDASLAASGAFETVDQEYLDLLEERREDSPEYVLKWTLRPTLD